MDWLKAENPICIKGDTAVQLSKALFYFTYIVYLIMWTAESTTYRYEVFDVTIFTRQIMWICCGLAFLNILFLCRYTVGQIVLIIIIGIFYLFLWVHTQNQEYAFLQGIMIVLASRNVKWDKILKFLFAFYIFLILTPILLEKIGIFPVMEFVRNGVSRSSLGFSHPNVLGGYCLCFVIIWLLIRYHNLKIFDYLAWIAISAFLWIVPNSKTSTFLVLAICAISFIFKNWGEKLIHSRVVQSLCLSSFCLMSILSIAASYFYNAGNSIYVKFDQTLFTTRLSYAHTYLIEYSIKIFGQNLKFVNSRDAAQQGVKPYILDNFYVRQLIGAGVIAFFITLGLFTFLMYRVIRTKDQAMLIALLILIVYCVYENRGNYLVYNVLMFQYARQLFNFDTPTEEIDSR